MNQDSGDESWLDEQCHREINAQSDSYENEYVHHRDSSLSTVWGAFQDSATAVAQLFRERSSNTYPDTGALWIPFQTAAGTVTTLYKESCDGLKRSSDAAMQCGYQRRNRELAEWARSKKRRLIRRDDLLAYLACRQPLTTQYGNRRSPKPETMHNAHSYTAVGGVAAGHTSFTNCTPSTATTSASTTQSTEPHAITTPPLVALPLTTNSMQAQQHQTTTNTTTTTTQAQQPPSSQVTDITSDTASNDLHTFKEALVLRPRGPELFAFVANEIARHCKRPASPIDDKMDVCHYNSKRQRFM